LLITLGLLSLAFADFNDGLTAANKGDFKTAYINWEPLAKKGDSESQANLGLMYLYGNYVKKDYKKAIKWFKKITYGTNIKKKKKLTQFS